MDILFINASPRKNGYTVQTLIEIRNGITTQNKCHWIDVNNLNIKPCQGCLKCRPNKECLLLKDDGHHVARLIKKADSVR